MIIETLTIFTDIRMTADCYSVSPPIGEVTSSITILYRPHPARFVSSKERIRKEVPAAKRTSHSSFLLLNACIKRPDFERMAKCVFIF